MEKYILFTTVKPLAHYPHLNNDKNLYGIWVEVDGRKATTPRLLKRFYKQVSVLLEPNDNHVKRIIINYRDINNV